ncbi:hypothetical protein AB0L57_25465 [Nocardia sp. NPDC052254]|uniref:hypothetical protein n=1 Tax=Nocardia sp. NPDC052254 TaxID=3155681 RepID=UPI00342BC63A
MDVGQSTANALWQQAVDGTFKMEPGAAHQCAKTFERFAQSLDEQVQNSYLLHRLAGFGNFKSAEDLQRGFEGKAENLTTALVGMQEAALKMAAAYLRAGNDLQGADDMNRRSINTAASVNK